MPGPMSVPPSRQGSSRRPPHRGALLIALGVATTAALSACGAADPSGAVSGASTTVTTGAPAGSAHPITLTDYRVAVPATMKVGSATYAITNSGAIEHELLVFKSDLDPAQYPYIAGTAKFDEAGAGVKSVSDGDNLAAGASQSRSITLAEPGRYLFVCNLPGHFRQGMYAVVTVTP